MPNTLAHLGIAGVTTRSIIKSADLKWIYLGAIIPDLPWIFQRLGKVIIPDVSFYDLRLYVIIQSTYLFCLIAGLAISFFSKEYLRTFLILASGSLIHLLLDSLQKKWANGVHLFAPVNWDLFNLNLFWPESIPTYLITIFGLAYFIVTFKKGIKTPLNLVIRNIKKWIFALIVVSTYFIAPLYLIDQPRQANNHFVNTLENYDERPGKYFEMDRSGYRYEDGQAILRTFAGEDILLKNIDIKKSGTISIRARFIDKNTAEIIDYHIHSVLFRDGASYIGLLMIIIFWGAAFFRNRKELKVQV